MASHAARPSTPPGRPILHDSPFSDYYSDSPFSVDPHSASKTQSALLHRLSQLAVQVTREEPVEPVAYHVQRALDNLYALFAVPDSQTRQPDDLHDSGLFIEDETESPRQHAVVERRDDSIGEDELEDVYGTMIKMSMELREGFTEMKAHQTGLMADMTQVTRQNDNLKAENNSLKSENKSLRSQNGILQAQVTALRAKIESLRTQNHSLRTDLQSDFTELMSLKLQLMAIEVKSALHLGGDSSDILKQSMERWTDEWHEMDEKFRERREKFSGAVDPNLLGEAHQLAADISAFLNLEDGNLKPKSTRHIRNLPGIHARGLSDPLPAVASSSASIRSDRTFTEELEKSFDGAVAGPSHTASSEPVSEVAPETDEQQQQEENQGEQEEEQEEETPAASQSKPGFLARFWRSGPKNFAISKSTLKDPRKSIWDALSDVAGIGMYDDFYDDYNTTE